MNLLEYIKYNKYDDYLLNYTFEDFLEDPKNIYGDKIEILTENNSNESNNDVFVYLEFVFDGFFQGNYYDMYNKYQSLLYESLKLSEDMSDKVYEDSKGIVYHICPNYVVDKILEYGLRPKGGKNSKIYKNRVWHPKSVYVVFGDIDNNTKEYFKREIEKDKITTEYDDNILNSNEVTILKIDLNKYNRKLKFYKDTLGGKKFVYTKEYIPPQCISIYKENKLKRFIQKLLR